MASIKLDGTYCLVFDGELYTRKLKVQPNRKLKARLGPLIALAKREEMVFMGELYDHTKVFNEGQSSIRAYEGDLGEVVFQAFDCLSMTDWLRGTGGNPFFIRYEQMCGLIGLGFCFEHAHTLNQGYVRTAQQAQDFYDNAILSGYEGIVTRDPKGYYKHGRCTANEHNLFRHREIARCEATILSVNQGVKMRQDVTRTRLLNGNLDKPHKQGDYEPDEIAGSLTVRTETGIECNVGFGEGWTAAAKAEIWKERKSIVGRTVEVKYNPLENKDKLRQPKLVRFRDDK